MENGAVPAVAAPEVDIFDVAAGFENFEAIRPITEMPFKLSFVKLRTDIIPSGCGFPFRIEKVQEVG